MNSQEMILHAIATKIAAREDVVLIDDRQWANTGVLRTVTRDTLDHIASLSYDFQSGYCNFGPISNRVASLWYGKSTEGKRSYVKGSISELVATVVAHLLKENA